MPQQLKFSFPSTSQFKRLGSVLSKKEKFVLYLSIFILLASLIAWAVYFYITSTHEIPAYGGEYTEGIVGQPLYINPILSQTNEADSALCKLIFSSLMTYDNQGNLIPDLAESYDVSEDEKIYTFHIKRGVKWHDATELKAQDIVFTVGLIQDQIYKSSLRGDWQEIKASSLDDYTVQFELSKPYAPFPNKTTFGILPKHIFEGQTQDKFFLSEFNLKPVGSGPFEYSQFKQDSQDNIITYQLLANKSYYGNVPFLDEITFNFYDSEDSLFEAYKKKEINAFGLLSYEKASLLENRKDTTIHQMNTPRYFGVFTNQTKSVPLADKNVRKALQYATDKDKIIAEVFKGYASKTASPFLETFNQFSPAQQKSVNEFNIGQAERLLDEAGWKKSDDGIRKKDDQQLEISLITTQWVDLAKTAELLKTQWEAVGVRTNISTLEISDIQQNFIKPREYQSLLFGQEYFGNDPDPYYFWHSEGKKDPGRNIAVYDNEEVDQFLAQAREKRNVDERKELYGKFEEQLAQDAPAIFLYSPKYIYLANSKIKGIATEAVVNPSYRYTDAQHWYIKTTREKKEK